MSRNTELGVVRARVETEWLTCRNLQVSCKRWLTGKNLQVEWLTCKNLQVEWLNCKNLQVFGKKACKAMHRLVSFCQKLAISYKITIRPRPGFLLKLMSFELHAQNGGSVEE